MRIRPCLMKAVYKRYVNSKQLSQKAIRQVFNIISKIIYTLLLQLLKLFS